MISVAAQRFLAQVCATRRSSPPLQPAFLPARGRSQPCPVRLRGIRTLCRNNRCPYPARAGPGGGIQCAQAAPDGARSQAERGWVRLLAGQGGRSGGHDGCAMRRPFCQSTQHLSHCCACTVPVGPFLMLRPLMMLYPRPRLCPAACCLHSPNPGTCRNRHRVQPRPMQGCSKHASPAHNTRPACLGRRHNAGLLAPARP